MKNYFQLLELPENARLDAAHIRQQYFVLQRQFHPDNAKNTQMRLEFLQISADINTAYHILKDCELRLYYLLKLRGIDILADNPQDQGIAPSAAVLMEAMELREEMMEAATTEQKQQFASKIKLIRDNLLNQAIDLLAKNDMQKASNYAIRLRYISKITNII